MKNTEASAAVPARRQMRAAANRALNGFLASRRLAVSAEAPARKPASAKNPVATIARGEKARPIRIELSAKESAIAAPKPGASRAR